MSAAKPGCRQCFVQPARAEDEFCSAICARDYARRCDRIAARETVNGEVTRNLWVCGQRLNLQNSA